MPKMIDKNIREDAVKKCREIEDREKIKEIARNIKVSYSTLLMWIYKDNCKKSKVIEEKSKASKLSAWMDNLPT